MERIIARDRSINIVSGHMGAGKSYYFEFLTGLPENQGPNVFTLSKDAVIAKYFSNRTPGWPAEDSSQDHLLAIFDEMMPRERIYADELLRVDVERAILVGDAERIFLDMSMRSREKCQEPFVDMVKKTEHILRLIAAELAEKQGLPPPDPAPSIYLRVVFLFCNFETIRRRMATRWPHLRKDKLPAPVIMTMSDFKIPTTYQFLALDTSDEDPEAERKRKDEIKDFFGGRAPDPALITTRAQDAERCLAATQREVQKFLP